MKTKVVAVVNQKGGVGKTTTTANLGYVLAKQGKDVLLIDFDSQASLTNYFNVGLNERPYGIYEMLIKNLHPVYESEDPYLASLSFQEMCEDFIIKPTYDESKTKVIDGERQIVIEQTPFGVSLLPSSLMLTDYELELIKSTDSDVSAFHLYAVIEEIKAWHEYDYILIDCNPSLGILTMNAIVAALDGVLIPTNLDVMSTRGVVNLINRIVAIQEMMKETVQIEHQGVIGIVLNLYSDRRTVDKSMKDDMERFYPFRIFKSQIPESINAKKAVLMGLTYCQMYKKAETSYTNLATEFEKQIAKMQKRGARIINLGDKVEDR